MKALSYVAAVLLLLFAFFVVIVNFVMDLVYVLVDPRIRMKS